jgi:hypothetical protein
MAITKYKKPEIIQDDFELQCTAYGCFERWSIKIEKPMCSFHQWKKWPIKSEEKERTQEDKDNAHDPKWWAKKIMRDEENGIKRPVVVFDMAKRALNIKNDLETY